MGDSVRKSELRRSARFHVDDAVPLVYRKSLLTVLGFGRINEARAAVNLSEGGILIRTGDRVKSGVPVRVRLEIGKFNDVIEAEGVVRWCFRSAAEEKDFFAGIRFTAIADAALLKIRRLHGFFTSPEYRTLSAARKRRDPLGLGRAG